MTPQSGVVHDRRDWNPLGAAIEEPLSLGAMAARAAAAIRRRKSGIADDIDRQVLGDLSRLLTDTAAALEYVESRGATGQVSSRNFATITALEVLGDLPATKVDSRHLRAWLTKFARTLDDVASGSAKGSVSDTTLTFLAALSDAAIRRAGTTGELSPTL